MYRDKGFLNDDKLIIICVMRALTGFTFTGSWLFNPLESELDTETRPTLVDLKLYYTYTKLQVPACCWMSTCSVLLTSSRPGTSTGTKLVPIPAYLYPYRSRG